jgi:hypothetical protein
METPHTPRVTYVDRLDDGVAISFEDGRSIVFTGIVLYSMIFDGVELDNTDPDKVDS